MSVPSLSGTPLIVILAMLPACSASSTSTGDAGTRVTTSSSSNTVTPCTALAECCTKTKVTGLDSQSCAVPFDGGPSGEGYCQSNFDGLRRDGFCGAFAYTGFVPYTLGKTPATVTMEPSACAALTGCCVSNEVWGDAEEACKGFATGTTDQTACSTTFTSLRSQGYCGGFTFTGAAPLGGADGGP
jgi:hypothetical protein